MSWSLRYRVSLIFTATMYMHHISSVDGPCRRHSFKFRAIVAIFERSNFCLMQFCHFLSLAITQHASPGISSLSNSAGGIFSSCDTDPYNDVAFVGVSHEWPRYQLVLLCQLSCIFCGGSQLVVTCVYGGEK